MTTKPSRPERKSLVRALAALAVLTVATTALTLTELALSEHPASAAASKADLTAILKVVDERQKNQGDWHSHIYMEQKERDKVDVVYEGDVYRRSEDQRFVIVFTKPKASQGQGYLR